MPKDYLVCHYWYSLPVATTEATLLIGQIQALPVTVDCLVKATRQDPILS